MVYHTGSLWLLRCVVVSLVCCVAFGIGTWNGYWSIPFSARICSIISFVLFVLCVMFPIVFVGG